jgi:hypothetical protein
MKGHRTKGDSASPSEESSGRRRRRGSTRARAGARAPEHGDKAEDYDHVTQTQLARELIGVCLAALKSYGLDETSFVHLAREATAQSVPATPFSARLLSDTEQLAKAINGWGEEPRYLDATGQPAVLPIAGAKPCFADLAGEFFPKRDIMDVVRLGCSTHVMERVGTDKVARISSAVLFPGNSVLTLANTVRTVRWLLGTADHNRRLRAGEALGFPDRSAHVEIPAGDFAKFVAMVRPQISGLLEMCDRWLLQRSQLPNGRSGKKRLAGIQVFVFRE